MGQPWIPQDLDPSFSRTIDIDYCQIRHGLWRAKIHLQDPIYNVVVDLDLSMSAPNFTLADGSVRFLSYPHRDCVNAASKIKKLVGSDLRYEFRGNLQREYLGPQGCDTLFNMINVSCRAFLIRYLVWQRDVGNLTAKQYDVFLGEHKCAVATGIGPIPGEAFAPSECVPALHPMEANPEPIVFKEWDAAEPVFTRKVTVDYIELTPDLWRVRAQVVDFQHSIILKMDVSTEDLVVQDAKLTWLRQPYFECGWEYPRIERVVGACLATNYSDLLPPNFTGGVGCGNVYGLLNLVPKGFMQFYLWRKSVKRTISPAQVSLCKGGLKRDCIACGF